MYTPSNPDWCYTIINIPDIESIRHELHSVLNRNLNPVQYNEIYVNFMKDNVIPYTPVLSEWLSQKNVLNKFHRVMFSKPNTTNYRSIIHVDTYDKHVKYSLNIPIQGCEGTYTVFYKAPKVIPLDRSKNRFIGPMHRVESFHAICDETDAVEIARIESCNSVIVNTTIPHKGDFDNTSNRVLACLRFQPELTYKELHNFGVHV